MDDLLTDFLTETYEALDSIDVELVELEQNPNNKDIIGSIFRLMHTIKGTCGFLGLGRLEKVAHSAENVMGRFRDGDLEIKEAYVTLIFDSIDRIKMLLKTLEQTGAESDGSDADIIAKLDAVFEGRDGDASAAPNTTPEAMPEAPTQEVASDGATSGDEDIMNAVAGVIAEENGVAPTPVPAPKPVSTPEEETPSNDAPSVASQSLRVSVDVLENLMNMVSELVLTRNQLLQILRNDKDSVFSAPLQRLNHVVSDLQEGVMQTRMQPVGNAWAKLPRIIRDISNELGKKIKLDMVGQDTELDRQVLDMIKDPLTHMVRNSADHGIETPEARLAVGKPDTGTINLNAFHEGGHIIIEIADDGKGLPLQKIKEKAIANKVCTPGELLELSDKQIQQFIFHAGFSTAEKVTSVSGRGVGMDVVRTNIEKIGGTIDLDSVEGQGSKFTIKIPLTLAIVSALIVECAGERYAVPQLSVQELVMISAKSDSKIEMINDSPVYRLRDKLLPLVHLNEILGLEKIETEGGAHYIIVTQVGSYIFGIVVDKVFDTEEIVVKPVSDILKSLTIYSGNTILGDGSVIMIIDPAGIARASGESVVAVANNKVEEDVSSGDGQFERTTLLLFNTGDKSPKAVPLSLVARLEEIDMSKAERSGDNLVIQYRNELMPLIPFNDTVKYAEKELVPTIVFANEKRSIGLMVGEILDIVEDVIDVQISSKEEGLLGSAIIQGKATDVVDVGYFLSHISKASDGSSYTGQGSKGSSRRVLLVDDSPFFRNMLTPLLSVAGYEVTSSNSAIDAQKLCEAGEAFDIIISDIEMPEMDGFEFAQWIKGDTKWSDTPLVALSSHTAKKTIDKGKEAGFNDYVAKFDRDGLLETLSSQINSKKGV